MIVIVGEEDVVVGDLRGRQIFTQATAIPPSRKRFILFRSDRHGHPPLIAEHTAPTGVHSRLDNGEGVFRAFQMSLGDVNALDRAGFWRMADVTWTPHSRARPWTTPLATKKQFRHLGFWSDGRKVTQPIVGSRPRCHPPRDSRQRPASVSLGPVCQAESRGRSRCTEVIRAGRFDRNPPDPHQSSESHQEEVGLAFGLNPAGLASDTLN